MADLGVEHRTDERSRRRAELLAELVAINSVNPGHAGERSGPGGEAALAEDLAARSESLGGQVTLDEAEPGRPNLYALFPGRSDRTVAVDVHLDTVGVEHMEGDPFDGRIADGRVYGRGSVDTKATFAVILDLLADRAAGLIDIEPSLLLVGTVGEEYGGLVGANRFSQWAAEHGTQLDAVVVAEPTMCAPVHGHKGGLGLEITVHGHAAHSSKPELGANAISGAARIVNAYDAEQQRLAEGPALTAMGPGTLGVMEISGGLARNIIPDECQLYAGRRIAPGEDPEEVYEQLTAMARDAAAPLDLTIEMSNGMCSPAFYEDPDTDFVRNMATITGVEPEVATYGTNALVYHQLSGHLLVFGPGSIDQAHQAVEWIDISELDRAADIYRQWLT
jgi:acetylornithine deacetylase/succinyl-diaminopimelate desuccinylase-like protein